MAEQMMPCKSSCCKNRQPMWNIPAAENRLYNYFTMATTWAGTVTVPTQGTWITNLQG